VAQVWHQNLRLHFQDAGLNHETNIYPGPRQGLVAFVICRLHPRGSV
jgi:hypothetical protein